MAAETIIFHGLFGSPRNWQNVVKALGMNSQCIALPGHSNITSNIYFDWNRWCHDLVKLNFQEDRHYNVIGHSLGGLFAAKLTQMYPNKVRRLILVDIVPKPFMFTGSKHHQYLQAMYHVNKQDISDRREAIKYFKSIEENEEICEFIFTNYKNGKFTFDSQFEKMIERIGETYKLDSKINTPTLIMKGSISKYVKKDDTSLMNFTDYTITEIAGAGHWPHFTHLHEFVKIIKSFV